MLYYLAYGSNLHPLRLQERISSARLVGTVSLPGYRLAFHKRSDVDASGKASLVEAETEQVAHGAVYEIAEKQKQLLDRFEGLGVGYHERTIPLSINGGDYLCFYYMANSSHLDDSLSPLDWYKGLVITGARYHCFPLPYIRELEKVDTIRDDDRKRSRKYHVLLDQMLGSGN